MPKNRLNSIDWEKIQFENIFNNLTMVDIREKYGISRSLIDHARREGLIVIKNNSSSEKVRKKISQAAKKRLLEDPEKCHWKKSIKFISKPCEMFKSKLRANNICFVEEYMPLKDRLFSIDIAFPDKKIGIEINGTQHYMSDGNLKPYYKERHDLITSAGWTLLEYNYKAIYNEDFSNKIIYELKNNFSLSTNDYKDYINEMLERKVLNKIMSRFRYRKYSYSVCNCGDIKYRDSDCCINCFKIKQRTVRQRPSKDILMDQIQKFGYVATGKIHGVSDNSIRKWLKNKLVV